MLFLAFGTKLAVKQNSTGWGTHRRPKNCVFMTKNRAFLCVFLLNLFPQKFSRFWPFWGNVIFRQQKRPRTDVFRHETSNVSRRPDEGYETKKTPILHTFTCLRGWRHRFEGWCFVRPEDHLLSSVASGHRRGAGSDSRRSDGIWIDVATHSNFSIQLRGCHKI